MEQDPLGVDPDTMRQIGHRVVDWLVEREQLRASEPVLQRATTSEMAERLGVPAPLGGSDLELVLRELDEAVLPFRSRIDHPRYLAYVPGSSTWPGALADLIASTYNIDVGNWMESAGPSQLELTVLDWFASWIGYPGTAAGVLVSGGSAANLTALACARESLVGQMREDLVVYVSDQGHSSLARAARVLGFGPHQVRVLPSDNGRMRTRALTGAVRNDLDAGRQPLAVLAAGGTTNTGAVDPLPELSEICREHSLWLHVDAAYGGFATITERGRAAFSGLELADSVTLDPHKWLYQPFECGAVLVREGHLLREAFEIHPDYLQDSRSDREVNIADQGLQLTRMSRALKVWVSLKFFGLGAFVAAVDACLDLAERAEQHVESSPDLELMAPATLGIVCFRRHPEGVDDETDLERLNQRLVAELAASGYALISSTRLQGRYALRVCILNHETTWDDVRGVLDWLAQTVVDGGTGTPAPAPDRPETAAIAEGWPSAPAGLPAELRTFPLLLGVDDATAQRVATLGRQRLVAAGQPVVRQWGSDREFFLLLEGEVEVTVDDSAVATMHAGEFFGELAAFDWGAEFSYPRLASVTASTDCRLLVLADVQLRELMAEQPLVDARVRQQAAVRLRGV